jgi:hypothetical protein
MPLNEATARLVDNFAATSRFLSESASLLSQTALLSVGDSSDTTSRHAPDAAIAAPDAALAAPDHAVAGSR